ncbi:hypothetical protein [Pseudoalteromonas sp. Of7M-16]|uniref:hypothetical protein n=1 Tax=Pseudoalteromonas sp. Of7M-16 TaxID=2917756 RepID=UPI001EF41C2D|nr:hypothetical protein [Pseudoalteromonas sp. Of7M-16]MCG7550898.1 hypothetical protein [Pseudoalteromonas sp. Of7M-16]
MAMAYLIASYAHKDQKYGEQDYIVHVNMVRNKTHELFACGDYKRDFMLDDLACLHDVIEDTELTIEDIRAKIGHKPYPVEQLIKALEAITKQDQESREDYIARCVENPLARKVKIADTLSNLECSIKSNNQRRISKYTNQIKRIYELAINSEWHD